MTDIREHACRHATSRILIIGEQRPDVLRTAHAVERLATTVVAVGDDANALLGRFDFDVIVIDADTGSPGLAAVAALQPTAARILLASCALPPEARDDADVTILPAPADPHAVQALCRLGLRCARTARAARDAAHRQGRVHGLAAPAGEFCDGEDLERYEGLLTRSPAMGGVFASLRAIEASDTTVLVCGESGSGKELVAQAIHARSRRRSARFLGIDLATIPDADRERVLVGSADGTSRGLMGEAQGGCLFVGQVDSAGPSLQLALLRLVEEGIVVAPGSDRIRRIDVRVIAASSRDLDALARDGRFHADLLHQLRLCAIELPPLRARPEDIFPLAKYFLTRTAFAMGCLPPDISREARALLERYPWEGNLRELRNAMERAAIRCRSGLVIAADLPIAGAASTVSGGGCTIAIPAGGATLRQLEREIFQKTLALAGGNQSRAAQILGLCESTFRFRLQKLGIASRRAAPSSVSPFSRAALTARA